MYTFAYHLQYMGNWSLCLRFLHCRPLYTQNTIKGAIKGFLKRCRTTGVGDTSPGGPHLILLAVVVMLIARFSSKSVRLLRLPAQTSWLYPDCIQIFFQSEVEFRFSARTRAPRQSRPEFSHRCPRAWLGRVKKIVCFLLLYLFHIKLLCDNHSIAKQQAILW